MRVPYAVVQSLISSFLSGTQASFGSSPGKRALRYVARRGREGARRVCVRSSDRWLVVCWVGAQDLTSDLLHELEPFFPNCGRLLPPATPTAAAAAAAAASLAAATASNTAAAGAADSKTAVSSTPRASADIKTAPLPAPTTTSAAASATAPASSNAAAASASATAAAAVAANQSTLGSNGKEIDDKTIRAVSLCG
jgi:hypothetical protein